MLLQDNNDPALAGILADLHEIVHRRYAILDQEKAILEEYFKYEEPTYHEKDAYKTVVAEGEAMGRFYQSFSIYDPNNHSHEGEFWDKFDVIKKKTENDYPKALAEYDAQLKRKDEMLASIDDIGGERSASTYRSVH